MSRTLLLAAFALLVAGFVAFGVYQQEYVENETGGEMVEVVAANTDIPLGRPVDASWLTTIEIPRSYVEERHIPAADMRDLIGLPLAQSVRYGEAILRTDLSTLSDARRTLSGAIPSGMRAVTITVREGSTFGGLLRPGDRVDVVLGVGRGQFTDTWRSVMVLENVLVLAVGQDFDVEEPSATGSGEAARGERDVRFRRATNIALQVTPEQAALIAEARRIERGTMQLLLRNPNDIETDPDRQDLFAPDLYDAARRARFLRRTRAYAAAPEPVPTTDATAPTAAP